jgi:hypothetical protein
MRCVNKDRMIVSAAAFAALVALQAAPLWAADQGIWSAATDVKDEVTTVPTNYCNTKIRAPNNDKPSCNDDPQMSPQWQDWIDYSGPCDQADFDDAVREMKQTSADD